MIRKMCVDCQEQKPHGEFYATNCGLQNRCKECAKLAATKHRNANLDKLRAYDRKRGNRQPPSYLKRWRADNPEKYQAHNAANNALRDGKLERVWSCSRCDSQFAVHKHHPDYARPLDVEWLCAACHRQETLSIEERRSDANLQRL